MQGRPWEVWGREVVSIRSPFWKDHSGCQVERELEGAGRQGGPGGPWGASPLPSERGRSLGSLGSRGGERNSQARAPTGGSFGRTPWQGQGRASGNPRMGLEGRLRVHWTVLRNLCTCVSPAAPQPRSDPTALGHCHSTGTQLPVVPVRVLASRGLGGAQV